MEDGNIQTSRPSSVFGKLDWADLIPISLATIAAMLLLVTVLAGATVIPVEGISLVAVALALCIVGPIVLMRPRTIFYGFITLCMVIPHELEELSIPLGFMQVYPQDILFLIFGSIVVVRAIMGKGTFHSLPFNRQMLLYLALGIWATGVGLFITGNPYDSVFGDFRRSFFYFLAFFFALLLTDKPSDIRLLKFALIAGGIAVIGRGLLQAAAGEFVTRRFGDAAHIMNHFEITFSTFVVYYGLARISTAGNFSWVWIPLLLAGTLVVIIGNFRTCWIGFAVGLLVLTLVSPPRPRFFLLATASLAGAAIIAALALLWQVPVQENQSTIGENIMQKADWRSATTDTNVSWRFDSYRNALQLWQTQPIIGRGLGEKLEFYTATSTGGSMLAIGHRVHNSYLWLLMSLGISGFAIFVYVHWKFVATVIRALRKNDLTTSARVTLTASFSFYATIMTSALFDVYLESAPPITIISILMALCLLTIHYQQPAQTSCCEVLA